MSQKSMRRPTKPEILAPVGGFTQLQAAIENGADAVYFGLSHFNARARANNFEPEALPEIMARLHERGLLGFVTFNTLIFDEELAQAEAMLRQIVDAGVDAVIVQDLGAVRLIRAVSPDLPIHGSTQMTVTSAEGASLIGQMGVERVVLARELTVDEIAAVARDTDVELEVFVHGALCVSYSGQCFSSEAWGGRSANRGQCAQACRLPYDMIVDGDRRDLGDVRYLLSPQDLMGVDQIEALVEAGVSCFKIEGRLKGPEYVALTTRTYREAVDRAWERSPWSLDAKGRRDLTQIFSRGMTPGFLDGVRHQRLVDGRAPRHRGVLLGQVESVGPQGAFVRLQAPLKRGDGLVFDAGNPEAEEQGGKVYEIFSGRASIQGEVDEGLVELRFGPGVDLGRIKPGDLAWKTRDEALEADLRRTWEREFNHRDPVDAQVHGEAGQALRLSLRDRQGLVVHVDAEATLEPATGQGLDEARLRQYIGRMGGTPFDLDRLDVHLEGNLFIPSSALNDARRRAVEALSLARRHKVAWRSNDGHALPGLLAHLLQTQAPPTLEATLNTTSPRLVVLCRTMAQVEAAIGMKAVDEVIVDFLEIKGITEAIALIRRAGLFAVAAAPRILKPNEERIWRFMLNTGADAILVRSLGLLRTLLTVQGEAVPPLFGDFSLNAANALTVAHLLDLGLERLAPTHDLNASQLAALADQPYKDRLELIVHHHLPLFHTEHCVFCKFLSNGNDFRDCGRPCEAHAVHLKDREGREHVVLADMGCRNTVFNAEAQSGALHLPDFLAAGYRAFRIELLEETPALVAALVERYRRALDGDLEAPELWRWLDESAPEGVTLGSLLVGHGSRPMKRPARG